MSARARYRSKVKKEVGRAKKGLRRAGRLVGFICQGQRSCLGSFCFGSIFGCGGAAFMCSKLVQTRVGGPRFMFDRSFHLWRCSRGSGPKDRDLVGGPLLIPDGRKRPRRRHLPLAGNRFEFQEHNIAKKLNSVSGKFATFRK